MVLMAFDTFSGMYMRRLTAISVLIYFPLPYQSILLTIVFPVKAKRMTATFAISDAAEQRMCIGLRGLAFQTSALAKIWQPSKQPLEPAGGRLCDPFEVEEELESASVT